MKYPIYLFLIAISLPVYGQNLTDSQVREDLIQLKQAIHEYNPALEIYNRDFNSEADSLISRISENSISLFDAFKYISQLCVLSNEGHFSLGSWEDEVHAGFLNNEYLYLPISVNVLQGKLIVWLDNSNEQSLDRGDEIVTINDLAAEKILEKIYRSYPSDGDITTYVDRNIELGFSWIYYLYISQDSTFLLDIRDGSGDLKQVRIKALTREQQFDNYAKFYPERAADSSSETDSFHKLKHDGKVSYLTLPSFDYRKVEKFNINSKRFYKDVFSELKEKQISQLVIDLRGNTGGRNEFADDIVPFILKKDAVAPFLKRTISWEGKTKTYRFPKASKLAFTGDIFVLVNGRTYSAGNTLARYLYEYADATIIGEETGTRYEGFAAGSSQYITLKNSQIRIGIPRYHIVFPSSAKQSTSNRGLLPQHKIDYTINDIINHENDPYVDKVRALIQKSKIE